MKSKKRKSKPVASLSARASPASYQILLRASAAAIHNIRSSIRKLTIDGAIEIGRLLSLVQKQVPYGDWLRWLEEEFDWSDRSARNFINVYKMTQRANKLEIISNLSISPTALYLLGAPRTPDKVRDAVLARAEAGEKMSVAEVGETIAASGAQRQPSAATDQDQAQSADPEMDAILAKRAEHTVGSEPQTVAAAGTHSSRSQHANPRRKYFEFLKSLKPGDFRLELGDLCRAVASLERGCTISVSEESPEEVSGDSC